MDPRAALDGAVSVVLPTRNRVDFLRDSVASVLAQTFSDFECIVVDPRFGAYDYLVVLGGVFECVSRRVPPLDGVGVVFYEVLVEGHARPRPVATVVERAVHEEEDGLGADVSSVLPRHRVSCAAYGRDGLLRALGEVVEVLGCHVF